MAESFVHIGNKSIHFQVIGDLKDSATVAVLLHEALGSIGQWKNFPIALYELLGFPVVVPERSGHGKSSPLEVPRTAKYLHEYAIETNEFLKHVLTPRQKIILIGHSDGGTIALLMARYFPAGIQAIVTLAAHTFVEPETLAGIEPAVQAWKQGKLGGLEKYHGEKTKALFFAWADTWCADFFRDWDIRKEIQGIQIPLLAMQGDNDQYGTAEQLKSIEASDKNARIAIVTDCGHHPQIEKPVEIIESIGTFLKQVI